MEGKMQGFAAIVWMYLFMWRSIVFLKWDMQTETKKPPNTHLYICINFLSNPVNFVVL